MAPRQQQLVFSLSGLLSLSCSLMAVAALCLPWWQSGRMLCLTGAQLVNASGSERDQFLGALSYGLFSGVRVKQCGLGARRTRFSFFPDLLSAIPVVLHVCVIFFCGVVIVFSSLVTGFFFFNAFGRPYETLHGPMGLYLWTFICWLSSCVVMILFASEVKLHHLSNRISNFNEVNFVFQTYSEHFDRCFWLFLLVFLLHGLNFLLIRLAGIQFPFQESKEPDQSGGAADLMY